MASDTTPYEETEGDVRPAAPEAGSAPLLFELAAPKAGDGYRVLARKYRPQRFEDLIGQDAMVRTLSNAFASGRIAHAFMLTGVRGVGKTTTARIIARALNYETDDGRKGPTVDMPALGRHCALIAESRHPDVQELDAASRTGINDIREIIDSVRYAPSLARTKVYIVDEVHMLSTQAFNGLLKTLEEPPPHVKFIFATTEIRKVPVTVLSRCQRFDLRRIERDVLQRHLAKICALEAVAAEPGALGLIARAAEGSVRDSLSLLDQAIALSGGGTIGEGAVRDMLGLADRARNIDLLETLLSGRAGEALDIAGDLLKAGTDPLALLQDLAGLAHILTRLKLAPASAGEDAEAAGDAARLKALASRIAVSHLSRVWQMLLKGIGETQSAFNAAAAADMILVRIAYLSDLPPPEEIIRRLEGQAQPDGQRAAPQQSAPSPPGAGPRAAVRSVQMASSAPTLARAAAPPAPERAAPTSFADIVALAEAHRDVELARALKDDVHLVRFERGRIDLAPSAQAADDLALRLSKALQGWTGERWFVALTAQPRDPALTVRAQRESAEARLREEVAQDPLVAAILNTFPGSRIVSIKEREADTGTPDAVDETDDPGESD